MSAPIEEYNRIERYLEGVMPPRELESFRQELAGDPQLAATVTLHRELAETLAGDEIHQFRQTLKEVDAQWKPGAAGRRLRFLRTPRNLAIAAGLLLLIGFFAWLNLQQPALTNTELAARHFEQLPLETQMNIDRQDAAQLRKQAHEAYIAEQYEQAAARFLELSRLLPGELSYHLFLGVSQLGADRAEAAVTTLKPLADGTDPGVQGEAAWYLALAYLQMDNGPAARQYLEQLVRVEGYKWEEAREVLRAMDKSSR